MPFSETNPDLSEEEINTKEAVEVEPEALEVQETPEVKVDAEMLQKYKQTAEKVVDSYKRTIFARFGFGKNLQVKFGTTFSLDAKNGLICLDVKQYAEKEYSKEQIAWSVMMQLSKLSEYYSYPDEMKERAMYEKGSGKKRSLNVFMKAMDTIHHKHMVARKVPVFQKNFNGGREVSSLYNDKIFPEDDLTDRPKHLQYLDAILLNDFDRNAEVDPDVQELLTETFSYEGQKYTTKEIITKFLKPFGKTTGPEDRYKILQETLEEQYRKLLTEDLDAETRGNADADELDSDLPPEERDEYIPQSMESMEAGGKTPYTFKLKPGVTGYLKGGVRTHFDKNTLRWRKQKQLTPYTEAIEDASFNYQGKLRAGNVSLPLPYGAAIDIDSMQSSSDVRVTRDQHGAFYAESDTNQEFNFNFAKQEFDEPDNSHEFTDLLFDARLSAATEAVLEEVNEYMSYEEKADKLIAYIRDKYTYNVKAQGELYNSSNGSNDYYQKIDQALELECYTSNTFFVGLCRQVDVPARLITGHFISGKNKDGSSDINRNNGHAWSEIWNGSQWVRKDATPPGAPEDYDDKYDEQEENSPDQGSDEEVQEFVDDQKEEQDRKEREERERKDREWCEDRDIDVSQLENYRKIEKEVEPYLEDLTHLWQKIIYGRSDGMSAGMEGHYKIGDELDVNKAITDWAQVVNNDFENMRFMKRMTSKENEVKRPDLIRVRLLVDISQSMQSGGKTETLQKSAVLLLSSLDKFGAMLDFNRSNMKSKLQVDTQVIGYGVNARILKNFRSHSSELIDQGRIIQIADRLSKPNDMSTNDAAALRLVSNSLDGYELNQIKNDKTMEIVFEITDGGSDNTSATRRELDQLLDKKVIARAFQIGKVSSYDVEKFDTVWNDDRENPLGFVVGNDLAMLPELMTKALKEYLGNVEI